MAKKKKTKKKKQPAKSARKFSLGLDSNTTKGIWSVVLIAIAILSILSFFDKAGTFGLITKDFLSIVFGWGMYLVPFVLFAIAGAFILSWGHETKRTILFAAVLSFSSILGFFAITDYPNAISRGGYWGFLYSWPLVSFLGTIGAGVILASALVISFIIGFNVKLDQFFNNLKDNYKKRKSALTISLDDKKSSKKQKNEKRKEDIKNEKDLDVKAYEEGEDKKDKDSSSKPEKGDKKKKKSSNGEEFASVQQPAQFANFNLPPSDLLAAETGKPTSGDIVASANIIKRTLQNFGIDVEMGEVNVGPTVTQYTLKPAEGVKLARITALGNDLAMALAAHPIRIEAPIPGRSLVGVEIPNKANTWVRLKNLIDHEEFVKHKGNLLIALGRDVKGSPVYTDLSRMPHMLVAGSTGSGKTIALNTLILSMLYKHTPYSLRFIMIDPKRVEFSVYSDIPHLLAPIVVDNNKAVNALKWAVSEMERRFEVLSEAKSRDIHSYNSKKEIIKNNEILPFIVIVIDELADLMSSKGKEVEALIVRIAQMARAVGIHLVLATQRPSVEVITGLIKANITARVAFQVASQVDSRTVLDMAGAEKLLGSGDMLFLSPERSKPVRIQGAFVSEDEVRNVSKHLRGQKEHLKGEESLEQEDFASSAPNQTGVDFDNLDAEAEDELYGEAKDLVVKAGKASASYLQRRLRVGYARAASLLDMLEENGVIGPSQGAKPREVYFKEDGSNNVEGMDYDTQTSDMDKKEDDEDEGSTFYG